MLSKNEVKYIQSLCHNKQRGEHGLFIVEGTKMVDELIKSSYEVANIYATEAWRNKNSHSSSDVKIVTTDELSKISNLKTPNEVLAIVKQKQTTHEPVLLQNLTLVLDGIQDPGNMGTIIRIADWFGVEQIVASNHTVDIYNPKVVQASMGSLFRLNVWYKELGAFLKSVSIPIYGALLHGESIYTINKTSEAILIIGNEGKGISEALLPYISHAVTIPKRGGAESLNAGIATGIILSHIIDA